MKKQIALFLALVLLLLPLAGCGNDEVTSDVPQPAAVSSESGAPISGFRGNPDEVYYMCNMVSEIDFWVPIYEMFRQAGEQLGVQTRYMGTPEYDVTYQLAVFEEILALNPAGIFLHPVNADAFIEPINRAIAMGIPVVTFAADSPNSNRRALITNDDVGDGAHAADTLGKLLNGTGTIAILENPSQDNHVTRVTSFIAQINTYWPNIEIIGRAAANQNTDTAYQNTIAFLQAGTKVDAMFMPEAVSAIGAARAIKELGTDTKILCFDINDEVLDLIIEGAIWGAFNPDQGMKGYMGMITLFLSKHYAELIDPMTDWMESGINPVGITIDSGMNLVTAENAHAFYLSDYLERRNSKGVID